MRHAAPTGFVFLMLLLLVSVPLASANHEQLAAVQSPTDPPGAGATVTFDVQFCCDSTGGFLKVVVRSCNAAGEVEQQCWGRNVAYYKPEEVGSSDVFKEKVTVGTPYNATRDTRVWVTFGYVDSNSNPLGTPHKTIEKNFLVLNSTAKEEDDPVDDAKEAVRAGSDKVFPASLALMMPYILGGVALLVVVALVLVARNKQKKNGGAGGL